MLKRSLIAASLGLAVLALVPTAQAQSRNSIEIRQSGYANELAARVDGHRNRLSLEQRGVRQFISTLQDGTRNGARSPRPALTIRRASTSKDAAIRL